MDPLFPSPISSLPVDVRGMEEIGLFVRFGRRRPNTDVLESARDQQGMQSHRLQ